MTEPVGAVGPAVGSVAPAVTLPDTNGTPVSTAALRGAPVALVFFPFAFSGTCSAELDGLERGLDVFRAAGVRVLGVTCDPVFSLRAWSERDAPGFELLSDFWPHGAAARAYGVLDERTGTPLRASFLIDARGVVRWSIVKPPGQARTLDEYRAGLAEL